jgi:Fic family protein
MYIHELPDWANFHWNKESLLEKLVVVRHHQGRLLGQMKTLGFDFQQEAVLTTLTEDVIKTSEIEGEKLNKEQVRSSIARRLGLEVGGLELIDRHVEGIVEMMMDATTNFDQPLTEERLFAWHAALFPTARSGMIPIKVGAWRDDANGPMQVVSGPLSREKVHFQAPAADRLPHEMAKFLDWFNTELTLDPVLKAGMAHLWFISIHPFDDGNGRIARAITDLLLARSEQSSKRFYSMSSQIRRKRNAYYDILEKTQKGNLDISEWMLWFINCLYDAIVGAENTLKSVLFKAQFWEKVSTLSLNTRQRLVLNRLLDNFEGKLTSSKWAKLAKCSQDTAARDINELIKQDVLIKEPSGGRSTSYVISIKPQLPPSFIENDGCRI